MRQESARTGERKKNKGKKRKREGGRLKEQEKGWHTIDNESDAESAVRTIV